LGESGLETSQKRAYTFKEGKRREEKRRRSEMSKDFCQVIELERCARVRKLHTRKESKIPRAY
jgi:hypothetical protein